LKIPRSFCLSSSGKADDREEDAMDLKLFWGDIHVHSGLSRCFWLWNREGGDPDDLYDKLEKAGLDFAAIVDHEGHMKDEDWERLKEVTNRHNKPGKFVTFLGYEWSTRVKGLTEDRNVYYLGDDGPLLRGSDGRSDRAGKLFGFFRREGIEAIVIPHPHPSTDFFTEWDHDPKYQPVVEICSDWGVWEYFGNPHFCKDADFLPGKFYQDLLKRGLHLGAIASSDRHTNLVGVHQGHLRCVYERKIPQRSNPLGVRRPRIRLEGGFFINPINPCFAAVYAEELTREAIFDAIRKRHTYAAAGAKIKLDFRVNDHMMGEVCRLESPPFRAEVFCSAEGERPISKLEVLRNNQVIHAVKGNARKVSLEFEDEGIDERETYYYARAFQDDGARAWSSPVWVICPSYPDLSLHLVSSKDLPERRLRERTERLLSGRTGIAVWRGEHKGRKMLSVFWGGETDRRCVGEFRISGFHRYFVFQEGFQVAADLFTDDGTGLVQWNAGIGKGAKGLSLIGVPEEGETPEVAIVASAEGEPFEVAFLDGSLFDLPSVGASVRW